MNKKREIAVLKAFGASQEAIAILFMFRPIKFTIAIFKDTLIYTFVLMLIVNNVLNFKHILLANYYDFFLNIVQVTYGTIISFFLNVDSDLIDFHLHYSHIIYIFGIIIILFMIGSLIPAYRISKSNTIRMLATE